MNNFFWVVLFLFLIKCSNKESEYSPQKVLNQSEIEIVHSYIVESLDDSGLKSFKEDTGTGRIVTIKVDRNYFIKKAKKMFTFRNYFYDSKSERYYYFTLRKSPNIFPIYEGYIGSFKKNEMNNIINFKRILYFKSKSYDELCNVGDYNFKKIINYTTPR